MFTIWLLKISSAVHIYISLRATYYYCLLWNIHLSHSLVTPEPPVDHNSLLRACTFLSYCLYSSCKSEWADSTALVCQDSAFFKFQNHLSSPFLHLRVCQCKIFCMVPKESYNIPNATLPNVYTIKEMPPYLYLWNSFWSAITCYRLY